MKDTEWNQSKCFLLILQNTAQENTHKDPSIAKGC